MAMVVNHNLPAINANRQLGINNRALSKSIEKLSSGMQINRAADNAAGLAISEKMRGQINGLEQASKNAQDGISLIQTAEGALNETHDILQRMRTLAVQSANGTYQDEVDREAIQLEVDALKSEIDRISTSTHYNGIKLLDGSLSGNTKNAGELGPKFSGLNTADITKLGIAKDSLMFTADKAGIDLKMGVSKSVEAGHETAVWNDAGTELTITLAAGTTYSEARLNELIANADQEESTATSNPANVKITLKGNGDFASITTDKDDVAAAAVAGAKTVAGVRGKVTGTALGAGEFIGANNVKLTANKYGKDMNDKITIKFDATDNEGKVDEDKASTLVAGTYTAGEYTLHLKSGKEYSAKDIEKYLQDAGLDYSAELIGPDAAEADGKETIKVLDSTKTFALTVAGGAGYSADDVDNLSVGALKKASSDGTKTGGLTFQIGANGVEDQRVTLNVEDMSSSALKVADISVATRDNANDAIDVVDKAINTVSMQRAGLGALQNRLEHTINSLDVANENLTSAESAIRDTDMAKEMMKFTKQQILSQASQAMLAQANQLPQGVLQLLQ